MEEGGYSIILSAKYICTFMCSLTSTFLVTNKEIIPELPAQLTM